MIQFNSTDFSDFNDTLIYSNNRRMKSKSILILSLRIPTWIYAFLTTVGILSNVTNIIIFSHARMRSPLNFLLSALETTNIVIFCSFYPEIIAVYFPHLNILHKFAFCNFIIIVTLVGALSMSNWLTVTIGTFRVIAITFPFAIMDWCNMQRAKLALFLVMFSSLVFLVVYGYCNRILAMNSVFDDMEFDSAFFLRNVDHGGNSTYVVTEYMEGKIAGFVMLLVTSVPCLCTGVLTTILLRSLWKARVERTQLLCTKEYCEVRYNCGENEERITITMLVVLIFLFLAYIPDSVVSAILIYNPDSEIGSSWLNKFARSRFGILVSNCMTFFIYYCMSQNFRKTLRVCLAKVMRAFLYPLRKLMIKKI